MSLCLTCTRQGRTEKKMMPIKAEQEAAFFEQTFRTPLMAAGSSGTFRAACGAIAAPSSSREAFCGSGVA